MVLRRYKAVENALNRTGRVLRVSEADSARLGKQRQRHTAPEIILRRALRERGLRYRLSNRDLPGSPDAANRSSRWAVFVHGCYWHAHEGCPRATVPKNNHDFWQAKFARNRARDSEAAAALRELGYEVVTVWECETANAALVASALAPIMRRRRSAMGGRDPSWR